MDASSTSPAGNGWACCSSSPSSPGCDELCHLDWTDVDLVNREQDGRPLKLQYATRLFDRLRIHAGLPDMTLHGLRHQAASHLINSGAELTMVSKYLGHASEAVTSDLYAHLLKSKAHDMVNAAAALVPPRRVPAHTLHAHWAENEQEAVPANGGNGL